MRAERAGERLAHYLRELGEAGRAGGDLRGAQLEMVVGCWRS